MQAPPHNALSGISEQDRRLYERLLVEIRLRTDLGIGLLRGQLSPPQLEHSAVQLRKILELIVFGSLITNRVAVQRVAAAFHKKDAPEARKLARKANQNYWPVPRIQKVTDPGPPKQFAWLEPTEPYLSEKEWGTAYGFASDLVHAANPFDVNGLMIDSTLDKLTSLSGQLDGWFRKVVGLLNHHVVELVDRDYVLGCSMLTDTGGVQVAVFQKVGPAPPSR